MKIVVATTNAHKLSEIRAILGRSVEVTDLSTLSNVPVVDEVGTTFEANALLKAEAISCLTSDWVLADDSGLEVDALRGAPGVRSARFAGENADDAANRTLLLKKLADVPTPHRARFRCVLALAKAGKTEKIFEGSCEGEIIGGERGQGGFGYDPLFVPSGYSETFAELSAETKNRLSHRGHALKAFSKWLQDAS